MFIDIHVHVRTRPGPPRNGRQAYASPEYLVERYDGLGVECAVILPRVSPECAFTLQSSEEALGICRRHPGRLVPFCNVDPRQMTNTPDAPLDELLSYYKEAGCKGVGEVVCNLPFDDPFVENLFRCCEKVGLPLTFHIAPKIGGFYGLYDDPGLPLLEKALRKFPGLTFLGHSQPFWAEIGPLDGPEARNGYPEGAVTSEGRVVELMRKYPNLHGDLSAGGMYRVGELSELRDKIVAVDPELNGPDSCIIACKGEPGNDEPHTAFGELGVHLDEPRRRGSVRSGKAQGGSRADEAVFQPHTINGSCFEKIGHDYLPDTIFLHSSLYTNL